MAVIFEAPFGAIDTAIVLPNPQPGDKVSQGDAVTVKRAMDGTVYTYCKTNDWQTLSLNFNIQRLKAYELKAFIQSYHSADWIYNDYNGVAWQVKLKTNPSELVSAKFDPANFEWNTITLEFAGKQI